MFSVKNYGTGTDVDTQSVFYTHRKKSHNIETLS